MLSTHLPLDATAWPVEKQIAYLQRAANHCDIYACREWPHHAAQSRQLAAEMRADAALLG